MKILIAISVILLSVTVKSVFAQSSVQKEVPVIKEIEQKDKSAGHVQIIEDKRIDSLLHKYIDRNSKRKTIPGFRIRVFSANNQDNGRQRAYEAQSKFMTYFPGVYAYVNYEQPEWKLYVGDFRTRVEAYKMKKQIDSVFPNNSNRVIESQIDYNKL
jgi:hypothetical protein